MEIEATTPGSEILIEDYDNRCREKFLDGARCWNQAAKVVQFKGETRIMCQPHFDSWIEQVVMRGTGIKGAIGGVSHQ